MGIQAIQFKSGTWKNISITAFGASGTSTEDPFCATERFIEGFRVALMNATSKIAIIARMDTAVEDGKPFTTAFSRRFLVDDGKEPVETDDPVRVIAIVMKIIRELLTGYTRPWPNDNEPLKSLWIDIIYA